MALMTQAQYARHRGVTRQAVSQAVKDGRVALIRRRIDSVQADRDWPRLTEPLTGNFDEMSLAELRRQRALLDLKSAHLAYIQRCRQLIEVEAIRPALTARTRELRDRLEGLPVRVVPQLAGLELHDQVVLAEAAIRDVLDDYESACREAVERAKERAASGAS